MGSLHLYSRCVRAESNTRHDVSETSYGALNDTKHILMSPSKGIDPTVHRTSSGCSANELHQIYTGLYTKLNYPTNMEGNEGNILFNDSLNTFYLRTYGKGHSDSERGNPLPPHGLLFPISSNGSFICKIPDRIAHTTAFVTPVVEHWLGREIAQWVYHEESIRRSIAP